MDIPLTIGHAYHIHDESSNGFIGIGILREVNPPDYPTGNFLFELIDDPEGIEEGVFVREKIGEIAQRQDSITDQMSDLLKLAVKLKMYDAADWLRANFKGLA